MIPKTIHCVWLSGDEKPEVYKECVRSWREIMPDFEIKEWSLANLPTEVRLHPFVQAALDARKWAFATDYIRVWILYNYGGIYLDMDVMVYKSLEPFLKHRAFSCTEFDPRYFYKNFKIKEGRDILGLNIEAAVMGAEKGHPWIKDILTQYDQLNFTSDKKKIMSLLMPLIVTKASKKYGFRYIPVYQVLSEDIHIYGPDTFSSCYDLNIYRDNPMGSEVRFAHHLCAHGWYESPDMSLLFRIKRLGIKIFGKNLTSKIKKIFIKKGGLRI